MLRKAGASKGKVNGLFVATTIPGNASGKNECNYLNLDSLHASDLGNGTEHRRISSVQQDLDLLVPTPPDTSFTAISTKPDGTTSLDAEDSCSSWQGP